MLAEGRCFAGTRQPAARTMLVALPHAGGSAGAYRDWQAQLGSTIDVLAVRYPGHTGRFSEPLQTDCRQLAAEIAAEIVAAVRPSADRRIVLFGHSVGALIAYEIAGLLERQPGVRLAKLIVSGTAAPHLPDRDGLRSSQSDDEIVAALDDLDDAGAEALHNPELRELLLPILRAGFRVSEDYRPTRGTMLSTPIVAFGGEDDELASPAELDAWAEHTTGSFQRLSFPGGHFFLHNESAQQVVTQLGLIATSDASLVRT
jgi:surfactin synthase thioesterase subunit